MSGLSYLTCVKSNWQISNLRSESELKYSILRGPLQALLSLARRLAIRIGIAHTESLFAGYASDHVHLNFLVISRCCFAEVGCSGDLLP